MVCCFTFLFFKVLLNLPRSAGRPHGPSTPGLVTVFPSPPLWQAGLDPAGPAPGSRVTLHSPARSVGKLPDSLSFIWHFIVFQTLPAHFLPRPSPAISQETKLKLRRVPGLAQGQENPNP